MSLSKGRDEQPCLIRPPDEIGNGGKDVTSAGTAEQLTTTDTPCKFLIVFAKATNVGNVFVGGASVSSTSGMVLEQARDSGWIQIDNVNKVYVDALNSADGVQYCYVV